MNILAMVLAGGQGSRLHPLTAERSKPAVPFSGRYRIVDYVLSNLVNSDILSIYVLVQYKSQSLIEHINKAWGVSYIIPGQFVTVVPPQMREGPEWFQGTSDAISQNINLIERHSPDMVAVFGADHIYRMDVRQMVEFHQSCNAHVSVAAIPVPLQSASAFGVIDTDRVPLVQSLGIARAILKNQRIAGSLEMVVTGVKRGEGIAGPVRKTGVFPALAGHLLAVGEETGRLDAMFARMAGGSVRSRYPDFDQAIHGAAGAAGDSGDGNRRGSADPEYSISNYQY